MAEPDRIPDERLLTLRIIVVALALGTLIFAGIVVFQRIQGVMPPTPPTPVLTLVALAFGTLMVLVRMVLLPILTAGGRKRLLTKAKVTTEQLLSLYQTRLILGAALLEGPAFLFLVAYLLEGVPWALAGGLVFGAILAVLHFPTRERVEDWITVQRQALEHERMGW